MQGILGSSRAPRCALQKRGRRALRVTAHAPESTGTVQKDYLSKLRQAAIKLHTPAQLNPNKKKDAATEKAPQRPPFKPTMAGYLKYLQESKAVFDTLERVVAENPSLEPFRNTGLERGAALERDIQWFADNKGRTPAPLNPDGPGMTYVRKLQQLANDDLPSFMCHFYNINFAHTAGGRMIGKAVSDAILDGASLQFYDYGHADPKELGLPVKEALNKMAESWTDEEVTRSADETATCFTFAGAMMRCITQSCDCDCVKE